LGNYVAASPAIWNQRAYFGTFANQVVCVNLNDYKIAWRYEHPQRKFPYYASAAVTDAVVVIGGRDKMVHALNPQSGEVKWTFMTRAKIESSPVIVGERVIIASSSGEIHIMELKTGKSVWQFDTGSAIVASPSFASEKFVIGTSDGALYCFGKK
jgi:outer membrane protein assembly factor BamB